LAYVLLVFIGYFTFLFVVQLVFKMGDILHKASLGQILPIRQIKFSKQTVSERQMSEIWLRKSEVGNTGSGLVMKNCHEGCASSAQTRPGEGGID